MSWVEYEKDCPFPIQNLPYGVFHKNSEPDSAARIGVAIGDVILDLKVLQDAGMLPHYFGKPSLNEFMAMGQSAWKSASATLIRLLSKEEATLRDNAELKAKALVKQSDAVLLLPAVIGDYTDFYCSIDHATNIGKILRPTEEALKPNWKHLPVGYHGRASSVVVSGTPIRRPNGQSKPPTSETPIFGPTTRFDYELEMAFFIGPGNKLGDPISMKDAESQIFGAVLMNDWSARDVQGWEYIPLGPFNGKNLGTTISPWVVPLDALEPFRVKGNTQDPQPLPYLRDDSPAHYDIKLQVLIKSPGMDKPEVVANSNARYLYWSWKQMLVHHTSTGCNLRPGDLLATGTISGPVVPDNCGSIMELTWGGTKPHKFLNGETRAWLQDGDEVSLAGYCQGEGYRIGFGTSTGRILPAHKMH